MKKKCVYEVDVGNNESMETFRRRSQAMMWGYRCAGIANPVCKVYKENPDGTLRIIAVYCWVFGYGVGRLYRFPKFLS